LEYTQYSKPADASQVLFPIQKAQKKQNVCSQKKSKVVII